VRLFFMRVAVAAVRLQLGAGLVVTAVAVLVL
jgi:hypothetical protein